MLTIDIIKQTEALKSLSEEQIKAIELLSKNDEAATIGKRVNELYSGLDTDILNASGIAKEGSEKTYDYAKRVIGSLKSSGDNSDLQGQIKTLTTERDDLAKQIKEGAGDTALKGQLEKLQQQLNDKDGEVKAAKELADKLKKDYDESVLQSNALQVKTRLSAVADGLKYKTDFPDTVINTMKSTASSNILNKYKAEFDGNVLVYRDESGEIARNPNNSKNPYTTKELLGIELKDIIDSGHKQKGAGTRGHNGNSGQPSNFSLNAKSKTEAITQIRNAVAAKGIAKTDSNFQAEVDKIWNENKEAIQALPEQ